MGCDGSYAVEIDIANIEDLHCYCTGLLCLSFLYFQFVMKLYSWSRSQIHARSISYSWRRRARCYDMCYCIRIGRILAMYLCIRQGMDRMLFIREEDWRTRWAVLWKRFVCVL
jgi:hypothetical protein